MQALVIYESMFGNTRLVAEAIAEGITASGCPAATLSVSAPEDDRRSGVDLLVIGAPTHAHGLSTSSSRAEAGEWAADPDQHLTLEPHAGGRGVREWIDETRALPALFVAFDTRADMVRLFTGAASASIHRHLARRGLHELVPSESFLVSTHNLLTDGELDRATQWGVLIAAAWADRRAD